MRTLIFAALLLVPCVGCAQTTQDPPAETGTFRVKLETTKGDVVIEVNPDWAPVGAQHFRKLVEVGYFTDVAFFRVMKGFMAQFGISGDPALSRKWSSANIQDDPVGSESNRLGFLTYAKTKLPNSRSTQMFINMRDNSRLDRDGFTPIGRVISGMDIVLALYSGYGDGPPSGRGPDQGRITAQGNAYLRESFPKLDYIKRATIVE